jgi:hypothetical protein
VVATKIDLFTFAKMCEKLEKMCTIPLNFVAKKFRFAKVYAITFVIFVTSYKLFSRKAQHIFAKFSCKYENENVRFNPSLAIMSSEKSTVLSTM